VGLTIHLHLVPRLRISGFTSPLTLHTFTASTGTTFPLLNLSTDTATSSCTLEPPPVTPKCLHLSTTHAYLRDPYDFCNKQPPCTDTAFPDSPHQMTCFLCGTNRTFAHNTETLWTSKSQFRRHPSTSNRLSSFVIRYPSSPSVPLHHKFHEHDSVYTQRCICKYARFKKLSLRNCGYGILRT
jgi:hypothetical protein